MIDIINKVLPNVKSDDFQEDFRNIAIDSIDLVSLRVEIETRLGKMIPNKDWLTFKNINDILIYSNQENSSTQPQHFRKEFRKEEKPQNFITMPQMCLEALSENWLFKESGDLHWDLLCKGLGTSSADLKDDLGNRLYATFVRIRIDGSDNLSGFKENSPYEFDAKLSRFGMGMFFSKISFKSLEKEMKIDMMTSFSIRKSTGDNKSLAKSQPAVEDCDIPQQSEFPVFGNEYRLIKKGDLKTFFHADYVFNISEQQLFRQEYALNPYYDLNGVGLLYFASYPIINDYCTLQYFRDKEENWEEHYFTLFRDVMYYANCDAHDKIIFELNSMENLSENRLKIQSTLYRKSDGKMMARIFTIKQKKDFKLYC